MGKIVALLAYLLPVALLASGHGEGGTDFIPRLVNFVIFVAILWYFVAEPVKNFFVDRSQKIASQLNEIQERLRETKKAKEAAQRRYEEAQEVAEEIIEAAKRETQLLAKKMDEQLQSEIENMHKLHREHLNLQRRQVVRKTVVSVMREVFESDAASMDEEKFVQLIMKKVA